MGATKEIKDNFTDTPIICALVMELEENEILPSGSNAGTNLSGVSLDIPAYQQLAILKKILPSIRNAGVFYGAAKR